MNLVSSLDIKSYFTSLDWIIFSFCLSLTFIAIYLAKRNQKQSNYLEMILMSRSMTLPFFVATLITTWYGGIIAVSALSFEQGFFQFFSQGFFWYLSYLLFAYFLAPKINLQETLSLPHLVSKIFGEKTSHISAFLSFIDALPILYLTSLGILVQMFFGGHLYFITLSIGFFVVLYSIYGGFRAVIYVDGIQFILVNLAVLLVLLYSFYHFGNPFNLPLPEHYFTAQGTEGWLSLLSWALISLSVIIDPAFHHRVYATGSLKTTQKGILICILFWIFFDLSITVIALYARYYLPEVHPNTSFLIYGLQIVPEGIRGLVLAGTLATILSAVDTHLFVAANTFSEYFLSKILKKRYLRHYTSLFFIAFLCASIGYFFEDQLIHIFKVKGALTTGCFLLPMLFGSFFPKKLPDKAFVYSFWTGVVFVIIGFFTRSYHELDEVYFGLLGTFLSLTFFVIHYKSHEIKSSHLP